MNKGLADELFAALFLDARKQVRDFVQSEPELVGSTQAADLSSTEEVGTSISAR
jgi:hypothetical protein